MLTVYEPYFVDYVKGITKDYRTFKPIFLTSAIGFDGATASQQLPVFSPAVDADCILFAFNVDFNNSNVLVKITDVSSGYVWNMLQSTPTLTIAGSPNQCIMGVTGQVMPVLPLVCPFFLSRQSKLQYDFRNSATSLTTGGNVTAVGIKLLN